MAKIEYSSLGTRETEAFVGQFPGLTVMVAGKFTTAARTVERALRGLKGFDSMNTLVPRPLLAGSFDQ